MKINTYTCSACGYHSAIWHIRLNNSLRDYCENCATKHMDRFSHIIRFVMNEKRRNS